MKNEAILDMFDVENPEKEWDNMKDWQKHWKNMPEFINNENTPFRTIIVHLETQEALNEFIHLMKQKITDKTKYIYYPYKHKQKLKNLIYVDSENITGEF